MPFETAFKVTCYPRFWYRSKRVSQNGLFARLNKVFRWIDKVCEE